MKAGQPNRVNKNSNRIMMIIAAALVVVLLIVLWIGHTSHLNTSATTGVTPQVSASPSAANNGSTGDAAKTQYAPTPSPVASTAPSSTNPPAPNYITAFTVASRSDGFHVATVLANITGGSCNLTITPSGGSQIQKTGSVTLSGTTYMCDFGGDIPGSGTSGSASLTLTAPNGTASTSGTTF